MCNIIWPLSLFQVLPDGKWRGAPSHKPPSSQAFGPACTFLPITRELFLACALQIIEYKEKDGHVYVLLD